MRELVIEHDRRLELLGQRQPKNGRKLIACTHRKSRHQARVSGGRDSESFQIGTERERPVSAIRQIVEPACDRIAQCAAQVHPFFTRRATGSKASFCLDPLSTFSTIWGICFSLKAFPRSLNVKGFVTVLPRSIWRSEGVRSSFGSPWHRRSVVRTRLMHVSPAFSSPDAQIIRSV